MKFTKGFWTAVFAVAAWCYNPVCCKVFDISDCPFYSESNPNFDGYITALLESSQPDLENIDGSKLNYLDIFTPIVTEDQVTYEVNTTLRFRGVTSNFELVGSTTYNCSVEYETLFLEIDGLARIPTLQYDVTVELAGNDQHFVINGTAENRNATLSLGWIFEPSDDDYFNALDVTELCSSGEAVVTISSDSLSDEVLNSVTSVVADNVGRAIDKILDPLSEILSNNSENVDINDYV